MDDGGDGGGVVSSYNSLSTKSASSKRRGNW